MFAQVSSSDSDETCANGKKRSTRGLLSGQHTPIQKQLPFPHIITIHAPKILVVSIFFYIPPVILRLYKPAAASAGSSWTSTGGLARLHRLAELRSSRNNENENGNCYHN